MVHVLVGTMEQPGTFLLVLTVYVLKVCTYHTMHVTSCIRDV